MSRANLITQAEGIVHQGILLQQLHHVFPNAKIHENTRKESALLYPTKSYMEFDVWLPDLQLCFEFQDGYHYVTTWYNHIPLPEISQKDSSKRSVAQQNDMDLVIVPCWWDMSLESISATIHFYRPDLLQQSVHASPISLAPPLDFFQVREMPGVGELMLASFQLEKLATEKDNQWWMGEKYDGIRCCWNSEQRTVYSRTGKELGLPRILGGHLPGIFLDGEFWFGRGQYSSTRAVVHHSELVKWHKLRMISFDAPSYDMQKNLFEARYRFILQHCSPESPFNIVAFRAACADMSGLQITIKEIISSGGEGIILRKMGSLYEHGRSPLLLKMKDAEADLEAIVVGKEHDSVRLQLPDGTCCNVPPEDNLVRRLKIGDIVTVTHELRAAQGPMRHRILRIRTDLSWKEVVLNAQRERQYLPGFTKRPMGFWTRSNMRAFMENFAKKRKRDPLQAVTWYSISADSIRQSKSGRAVLKKFKGGYTQALRFLFPDLKFDNSAFQRPSWHETENRRVFFEEYARRNKFDPQNANNWYSESKRLMFVRGALGVIQYHNNSVCKALIDLFPNIGLEEHKFHNKSQYHEVERRRRFFEDYAKAHGFDPLAPEHWYSQPTQEILSTEGAFEVILHHGRSVSRALRELFPDIGLEKSRFWINGKWRDKDKRRQFFEEFAKEKRFDPLNHAYWQEVSSDDLMSKKGARVVLSFHKNSLAKALLDLFPDIRLNKYAFTVNDTRDGYRSRKSYLEDFAIRNEFDPYNPINWNSDTIHTLLSTKGISQVLLHYNNNPRKALLDLFPDIGLEESEFQPSWKESANRRRFFEKYATANSFDPLVPENWYTQTSEMILSAKGGFSIVQHHDYSVSAALIDLFPDIGLDKLKFKAKNLWSSPENRRRFFENYAFENGFDARDANAWYLQSIDWIMAAKGARGVMEHHGGSVPKALTELFPDVGLSVDNFPQQTLWHHQQGYRRKFFETFARANGFDPLVPENWYQQSFERIMSCKGILKVLLYHKRNATRALLDLFPDINLEKAKMWRHNNISKL